MDEIRIDNMEALIHRLNESPNHFVFRGQADADWKLQSALERAIGKDWSKDRAKQFEDYSISLFQSKFHLYDKENIQPDSKLAWLSIMQHYGVPTRLVDFTESPYVALYFALESYAPHSMHDFSVFAIDYTATMESSLAEIKRQDSQFTETRETLHNKRDQVFENVVDRFSYDILWITEPKQMNTRLDRQAGSFILSGNGGSKIETVVESPAYENVTIEKLRIDHSLYQNVFALLRKMNITSKSLYGDLDGLARSIRMEMQVRAV
ncbi:FRG domain protein [Bremerella volcania]|uniref:FRG domain protein n=1 Tax=Bremerella volcania TaxID=2527984 RepID=A0A518C2F6_9BACT|nr:FRG domain-containing protein [Bremerella volcania]QDU73364.1 FRG domain protein [Bremerella volcania]